MMTFSAAVRQGQALESVMGIFSILIFFTGIVIFALMLRQRRPCGSAAALLVLTVSYGIFQHLTSFPNGEDVSSAAARATGAPGGAGYAGPLPEWLILALCLAITAGEIFMLCSIISHRRSNITRMSIKEATDSLPMGILCYAPNGRILLANNAMEKFCVMLTGEMLTDGALFAERLHRGAFLPECRIIDEKELPVVQVADGTVWTVSEEEMPYENIKIHAMMVSDITDAYLKTIELRRVHERVAELNSRLVKTNREIVALTAEQELLAARVKIHDDMGDNLLFIKRLILTGGTEVEKAEILDRLRENVDMLKKEADAAADEYELMIGTARRLGVEVEVEGVLPQQEPLKQVVAAGIHECFTNALRHAHGDRLKVSITECENKVTVVYTNNGQAPTGGISEKGGLVLLRSLTEQAGGHMTVETSPELAVILELPKEI